MAADEGKMTETTSESRRRVRMDATRAEMTYSNFFTVQDGPEHVVIDFGFAQKGNPNGKDLNVRVLQQVVLHPASVRRLRDLLDKVLAGRQTPEGRGKPS